MSEQKDGCVKAARGPFMPAPEAAAPTGGGKSLSAGGEQNAGARRQGSPDFEANAYVEGAGFKRGWSR